MPYIQNADANNYYNLTGISYMAPGAVIWVSQALYDNSAVIAAALVAGEIIDSVPPQPSDVINDMITALGGSGDLRLAKDTYYVTKNKTIPENIRLVFEQGAMISVNGIAISAITKANPGEVTTSSVHGFNNGDKVRFKDAGGMVELNYRTNGGTEYTVTVVSMTKFTIGVNTSGYTTYTSGGYAQHVLTINGTIDAGLYQIFTGNGSVTLDNVKEIYPQWWGAKGDGVTINTPFIQEAINAVSKIRGGIIFFPPGNYIINAPLVLPSPMPIYFVGNGTGENTLSTNLKLANGSNCNMIEYTSTARTYFGGIKDMKIDGNAANQTSGNILHITGYWTDILLENIYFSGAHGACIYAKSPTTGQIANVWITRCLLEAGNYGIQIDCTDNATGGWWLDSCYSFALVTALYLDASARANGSRFWQINNCFFAACEQHGIYLKSVKRLLLSNSTIRNSGTSAAGTYDGIFIDNDATYPTNRLTITGNQFYNHETGSVTQRYGINLSGANNDNIIITDNQFDNHATGDINIFAGANANGIIRNNIGFVTENKGTATVANGTTSIAVNHGLSYTPVAGDISVTPTNSMCSHTKFFVGTYTSTQFTITVNIDPGVSTATFAWRANK